MCPHGNWVHGDVRGLTEFLEAPFGTYLFAESVCVAHVASAGFISLSLRVLRSRSCD